MSRTVIAIFALLVLTVSCGEKQTQETVTVAAATPQDTAALRVAVLPMDDCLPVRVADKLHIFQTLGVSVATKEYGAFSECTEALDKGLADGIPNDSAVKWRFITSKRSRVSRRAQLADKIVAADRLGATYSLARLMTDSLERKKRSVFIVQVEDLRVRLDMLISGNVDAALLPEPYASAALGEGAKELPLPKEWQPIRALYVFGKRATTDKRKRKMTELFNKAIAIAQDSIRRYGKDTYR